MKVLEFKREGITADSTLNQAIGELENVVVVGYSKDNCHYLNSNGLTLETVLLMLKHAEKQILDMSDE